MRRVIIESPYAGNSRWRVVAFFSSAQRIAGMPAPPSATVSCGEKVQSQVTCFILSLESCGKRSPEKDNRESTPDSHGVVLLRRPSFMPIEESARA